MGLTSTISRAYNGWRFNRHTQSAIRTYTGNSTFTLTPDTLQESIENGTLLGAYDLLRQQNIERYHPHTARLVGADVAAADPLENVEHNRVRQLTAADAKDPKMHLVSALYDYVLGGFARVLGTDAEMRDVAKGLSDLYKHAQYIQATQHRRLTEREAAADIDQYQTTAARRTLEQLTCDLEYVANVRTVPIQTVSGMGTQTIVTKVDPNTIQTQSNIKGLAAMPDAYKGLIQEGFVLTAATMSPLGFLAGYGLFKGVGIASRVVSDIASYTVRKAGTTYTKAEDGWKNGAEAIGSLVGLGTFGVAMFASGGLAFGLGTALVAGGVGYTYLGKKRRQQARDVRCDLEHALQTGTNPAPYQTQINNLLADAKRYEKNSSILKLASLVSLGLGVASHYGAFSGITIPSFGGGADTEVPTLDNATYENKPLCRGDEAKFTVTVSDNKDVQTVIAELYTPQDANYVAQLHALGMPNTTITPLQTVTLHEDGFNLSTLDLWGRDDITKDGSFTLANSGDYTVVIRSIDETGNTSVDLIDHIYRVGNCDAQPPVPPVPPGPHPPVPPVPPSPIPGTTDYADWDIRRIYDDHGHLDKHCDPSSYTGGAAHENAIKFDAATRTGTVQFDLSKGDHHTASIDNIAEDTRVFFEGYKNGRLEDAILVNIDASGKFDLSAVDLTKYDGYQVWWAEVNMNDAASKTLCVEALASYNTDNDPTDCPTRYIVEKEEACHSGSTEHRDAPGHTGLRITPPHYEPSRFVCEPGDFKFHFNGLTHYPTIGDEAHFMARGMGGGMLYTLETPRSYNLYQVGPGAICVEDNILLPHDMSSLRLDGVDLATGTRDTFGFGSMQHSMSTVASHTNLTVDVPTIPRPVPGMGDGVNDFGYNPFAGFEPDAVAPDVPRPVPMMSDDVRDFNAEPFPGLEPDAAAPEVPRPVPTIGGDVHNFEAQPFQDLDISANTPYIPEGILYVDNEAIQAFLRSQYENIDYKNVA